MESDRDGADAAATRRSRRIPATDRRPAPATAAERPVTFRAPLTPSYLDRYPISCLYLTHLTVSVCCLNVMVVLFTCSSTDTYIPRTTRDLRA